MFTRRHYETLARVMREMEPSRPAHGPDHSHAARVQWAETIRHLARTLKAGNETFQVERFCAACNLNHETNARP